MKQRVPSLSYMILKKNQIREYIQNSQQIQGFSIGSIHAYTYTQINNKVMIKLYTLTLAS